MDDDDDDVERLVPLKSCEMPCGCVRVKWGSKSDPDGGLWHMSRACPDYARLQRALLRANAACDTVVAKSIREAMSSHYQERMMEEP